MEIPNKELSKYYSSCKYHEDICCSAQRQEDKMEKRKEKAEKGKQSGESRGAEWGRAFFEDRKQKQEVLSNIM